jgi:hypothetical protein
MNSENPIRIGERARTVGPLRPSGRVLIRGQSIHASSEGTWIESDTDVVIVGGTTRRLVVRESDHTTDALEKLGEPLCDDSTYEPTPLRSPPTWVERIDSVRIGFAIGILLVPMALLSGTPFTVYALGVPFAAALAGWLFRVFVGKASEAVGPREDHRSQANAIAMVIVLSTVIGAAIALSNAPGFLGLGCGILLGALAGGILAYVAIVLSYVM